MKVALVCVAKWEDYYLEEWLEYNHKLGFDKIIMYQNDWRTDIEKPYLQKEICDGRSIQVPLYNNVLHNNTEYDWIAFIDCDEFIVLRKHKNIDLKNRYCNSLLKMFPKRNTNTDQHIKVIVNARSGDRMMLPHNTHGPAMDTNGKKFHGPFNPNGPSDVAVLNHYHNKTREDWMLRCDRGRVDCEIEHDRDRWDNEVNDNIDIVDLSAYNFLYGRN